MGKEKKTKGENPAHQLILYSFTLIILLIESIMIIFSGTKKGIFKKETLSNKSNLGFDFKIFMK